MTGKNAQMGSRHRAGLHNPAIDLYHSRKNSRIVRAGTKYFAMSLPPPGVWAVNFALMIPSRHLLFGSNTPDPELPVVATSAINVENLLRRPGARTSGEMMRDLVAFCPSTTMTGSP